jgi:hypothetical protein
MTLPRSVADVLADHVVFEVECIDRMYCNVYVPQLQHAGGLLGYIQRQLGLPIASTAPLGRITDAFSAAMRHFAREQRVPWVDFVKGQRKDDVMHEHLARFTGTEGVLLIGRAQEKTALFRTERRRDAQGESYPWIVRATGVVNQFYVLRRGRRLRAVLPQVLLLFPPTTPSCASTATSGPNGKRPRPGSPTPRWTRVRHLRRPGRGAGHLRPVGPGADRRAAAQVARLSAAPLQPRGPGGGLPLPRPCPRGTGICILLIRQESPSACR